MAAVLVAGCGGGGEPAPSAVTVGETVVDTSLETTTTVAATTTTGAVEAAVERAFHEQWDAFIEILSDPDPANPLIDRYFTGPAKERVLDLISEYVAEGKVARLAEDPALFSPRIRQIEMRSAGEALLVECTIDGSMQVRASTGEVIDATVSRLHFRNVLLREDGAWKVSETMAAEEDDPPCDFD